MFTLDIGHLSYNQLTAVKIGIRWPVSHECIVVSSVQLTEVTCLLKFSVEQLWFQSECRLRKLYFRMTSWKFPRELRFWPWLNRHITISSSIFTNTSVIHLWFWCCIQNFWLYGQETPQGHRHNMDTFLLWKAFLCPKGGKLQTIYTYSMDISV